MRSLAAVTALTAVAALTLGGCGGDDSDDTAGDGDTGSTDASSPTATDTGSAAGECTFLDLDQVSEATGADAELVAGGPAGCTFKAGKATVLVNYVPIEIDPEEYAEGTRDQCEGAVNDIDAGDIAFACYVAAPQGFVFSGSDSAVIDVNGLASDDDAIGVAASLLPFVEFPT